MSTFLLLTLLAADPTADQLPLLKTFRDEFITINVAESNLQPYAIGKYEVTQNLWQAVMGENPSRWHGPRNSVENLNLAMAQKFCSESTRLLREANLIEPSQTVRLPTEPEWEFAARAGTKTKYSFGDDAVQLGDYAWFTGNAAGNDPAVGVKKPNPWGLYDMHGYLWEWIHKPQEGSADEDRSVIRGGSWKDPSDRLLSSSRIVVSIELKDDAVGLRCVLVDDPAVQTSRGRETVDNSPRPSREGYAVALQNPIVPADSKLEPLWTEGTFTEGPALAPDGSILFSDIGETIYRYDPKTKQTAPFRQPSGRSNGLMFNQQGELIACEGANTGGGRRISITSKIRGDKDGTPRTLADRFDGKRFNSPNDLAIDAQGRVYFTDPRYTGGENRELDFEAVFLVATDGSVKVATRDISKPNGILVSLDGKTVFVADNHPQGNRHLVAFDVNADGTLSNKRILHDFVSGRGIDGMALDTQGNIYATAGTQDKAGVYVFSPVGEQLAMIPTPGDPTNCEFGGGSDASSLYITCANSKQMGTKYGLYRIRLNVQGHAVVKLNRGE